MRYFVSFKKSHTKDRRMNSSSPVQHDWKDLYRAALFEPNENKIPVRIAEAEKRIATRARELSHSGNHDTVERSALNVALYALFALKSSLNWNANENKMSDIAVA
jgi:hypothetical protein